MKNRMHACMAAVTAWVVVAVITQGSMQNVWATGKTITKSYTVASAKMTVKDTASVSKGSDSTIDIKVGNATGNSIDIRIDEQGNETGSAPVDLSGEIAGISYKDLAMANVEEAVNIRAESSEDSDIVGKLYKECAGKILERSQGWTKIETGKVTGWVKNDYLLFDAEAKRLADSAVQKVATSKTSCLRVRKEASQDAGIYDLLAEGDTIEVVDDLGDWVSVEFSDGTVGYVSSEYVDIEDWIGKGETIESIRAKEEADKKAREAASSSPAQKSGGSSLPSSGETATAANNVAAASFDDITLLASLIQSEAGYEPFEGQVAVGNVVMNRLRTGRFGNSLYSVIYAKGQFSPAGSGKVAQICAQGPKASCIQAAQAALAGTSYVGGAVRFRPVSSGYQGQVIGNHVFW